MCTKCCIAGPAGPTGANYKICVLRTLGKDEYKDIGVTVYWYDRVLMTPRPEELRGGEMVGDRNEGLIFVDTRGKIMTDYYGMNPTLLHIKKETTDEKIIEI